MSIANLITLSRAVAIVPVIVLLMSGHRWAAWWLFGFACATDLFDGVVARRRGEVTALGKVLDPLVDKAMYLSVLCGLYVLGEIPAWAMAAFLVPQVGLGFGALALRVGRGAVQGARFPGKAASLLAFAAIAFLMVNWPGGIELFYAAIGMTYIAGADYLRSALSTHSGA